MVTSREWKGAFWGVREFERKTLIRHGREAKRDVTAPPPVCL